MSILFVRPAVKQATRPGRSGESLLKGVQAAQCGNRIKARFFLRQAVTETPTDITAWHLLAKVVDSTNERIDCLTRVFEIDPASESVKEELVHELNARGFSNLKQGATAPARDDFRKAVGIDPKCIPALLGLASTLTNPIEAIGVFGQVLAIDPTNASAREGMFAHIRPSQNPRCPLCFSPREAACSSCPRCRATLDISNLNAFHRPIGCDVEMVGEGARRLAEMTEKQTADWFHLGLAYLNLGRNDLAAKALNQFALRPDADPAVREQVSRILDHQRGAKSTVRMKRPEPVHPFAPLVLVADDSPTVRAVVSAALGAAGYRTICVCDGTEIDAAIRLDGVPALILLDVNMPFLNGFATCKMLRQSPATRDIPIIFLSDNDGLIGKIRRQLAGATEYLTKPFKPSAVVAAVTKRIPLLPPPQPAAETVWANSNSPTERIQVQHR